MTSHVLMYHDVVTGEDFCQSGFQRPGADLYKLTCAQFEDHLEALAEAQPGAPGLVTDSTLPRWMITFDDGGLGALLAADMLEKLQWRGHFFITTAMLGQPGFLSASQVQELASRGHLVGSHSHTHPVPISDLSDEELEGEWHTSTHLLRSLLGYEIHAASVPGGFHSPTVAAAAAKVGLRHLFTSEPVSQVIQKNGQAEYGRFSIQQQTTAQTAVSLVQGGWSCAKQKMTWELRKIAKRLLGPTYLTLRARLLQVR
jgi:peptidoglycan/xylan/chitin deacetylase (PgdA/CDA1 family)